MRKLRILRDGLAVSNVSAKLGNELKAVKLSFVQALHFKGRFTSFEEMLAQYGEQKRLKENEFYDGYVAIFFGCWCQSVAYLRGTVCKKNTPAQDEYETVIQDKAGTFPGIFANIWTANSCSFSDWIDVLKLHGKLDKNTDSAAFDKKLKEEITDAAANNRPLRLTEEEYLVLLSFIPDKFSQIFVETDR